MTEQNLVKKKRKRNVSFKFQQKGFFSLKKKGLIATDWPGNPPKGSWTVVTQQQQQQQRWAKTKMQAVKQTEHIKASSDILTNETRQGFRISLQLNVPSGRELLPLRRRSEQKITQRRNMRNLPTEKRQNDHFWCVTWPMGGKQTEEKLVERKRRRGERCPNSAARTRIRRCSQNTEWKAVRNWIVTVN